MRIEKLIMLVWFFVSTSIYIESHHIKQLIVKQQEQYNEIILKVCKYE